MPVDTGRVHFGRIREGTTRARSSAEHTDSVAGLLVSGTRGRRRGTREGEARTKEGSGARMRRRREDACRLRGGQRQRGGRRQERQAEVGDAAVPVDRVQGLGGRGASRARLVFSMSGEVSVAMAVRVAVPVPGSTVCLGPEGEPLPARAVRVVGPVPGEVGRRCQDAAADEGPDLHDREPGACPPHRAGLYFGVAATTLEKARAKSRGPGRPWGSVMLTFS